MNCRFDIALISAQAMGLRIVSSDAKQGRIEAVDTTFWFGFKDDVVIRCQDFRVDLRSISRVGRSDLGANAKRIEQFIEIFQESAEECTENESSSRQDEEDAEERAFKRRPRNA